MNKHPYQLQPEKSFWASAVREPSSSNRLFELGSLVGKLSEKAHVCSAGSCFAQYIGKELHSRGYNYIKSAYSGERIESFGFGNIYTSKQFLQWLEFAAGKRDWGSSSIAKVSDGFFDHVLPHLEALDTPEEIMQRRGKIADELRTGLSKAQTFVFTLGLTEYWSNEFDDVYPICPGVLGGEFDPHKNSFNNMTVAQTRDNLTSIHKAVLEINPDLEIILTVSPVPLTATATNENVLVANTRSKSVLRAAVDEFVAGSNQTSYFPSYELITHNTCADFRMEENLRSVSERGVSFVMAHAFDDEEYLSQKSGAEKNHIFETSNETVCEEEMLEAARRLGGQRGEGANLFLVGDSHMGKLSTALDTINVSHCGGMIMNGSGFSDGKMTLSDDQIFIPNESENSAKIWKKTHSKLSIGTGNNVIVTNIGFQTHRTLPDMANHFQSLVLTKALIGQYFKMKFGAQLEILKELRAHGKVVLLEDPNFYPFLGGNRSLTMIGNNYNFDIYCSFMREFASEHQIEYFNPCEEILHSIFVETRNIGLAAGEDHFHGSDLYYSKLANILIGQIGASQFAKVA